MSWLVGGFASGEDILEHIGLGLLGDFSSFVDAVLWNYALAPALAPAQLLGGVPLATGGTFGDVLAADNQALAFSGGIPVGGAFANNVYRQRFDSEKIDALELGVKSEFANRRVRVNATLFDYDIEDFQVLEFTGVQFRTFNVPKAQRRGAEFEMSAVAGQHITLNFGYTFADSAYPDDCAGTLDAASVRSLCGAKLTNAPENASRSAPTGTTRSATGSWCSRR